MNSFFSKFLSIVILLSISFLAFQFVSAKNEESRAPLEVFFLDVGQGDAILVNYLNKYQLLIDSGPSGDKLLSELDKAMPFGDSVIELALLTHPDQDHLSGFTKVLDNYEVGLFLDNGDQADSQIFKDFQKKLVEKEVKRETVLEGSTFSLGDFLQFRVFNPDELKEGSDERNEQSIVLQMDFGEESFLFVGDAEESTELDMISDEELEDIDWLKVGHHGSKGASSEEFLKVVKPERVVISSGKENRYGHPHEETLKRLNEIGSEIFRTDELGTIKVSCWGLDGGCKVN